MVSLMQPNEETKIIQLLLARLERVSVDSYWAHRASGMRRALIRMVDEMETDGHLSAEERENLVRTSFEILERAAREKLRNLPT